MLHVVHGNHFETLADQLIERLPAADPFTPTTIVVGNPLVGTWLSHRYARQRDIAIGVTATLLDAIITRAYAGDAEAQRTGLAALDREQLAALIASVLNDDVDDALDERDELAPLARYLSGSAQARPAKRVQLATQLSNLYWSYALSRPEWLTAWEAGHLVPAESAHAGWQRALYLRVLRRTNRTSTISATLAAPQRRYVIEPRLPIARALLRLATPRLDQPLHVIGHSYFPRSQLDALVDLATVNDVFVYQLNPCADFWEDVPDRYRARSRLAALRGKAMTSVALSEHDDPLALTLWAKPARETIATLNDIAGGNLDGDFSDPRDDIDDSARSAMLADVLSRATATSANSNPGDPGIQIVACPSVARELEIIGGYVTAELRADPTLRANDIALWIAGPSEPYVTALPTVWGDAGIPFHLVDASSAMPSRAATALHALLELPFGSASRAELLEVMTNPFVLARCGSTDGDEWIAWTRELGIIAGDDEASHRGTYLEDAPGVFHWRQGLHRLALGALMHVPASNSLDADAALQPRYQDHVAPPHAVAPDRWRSAAMFIQLARSLLADVRWLKTVRASLTAWADIVTTLLSSYLVAPDDLASHELAALHADMASLARLDLDGRELDISELRELVRPRLERGGSRRGHVLSDGVLVAPLAPMRPIPRRRVFIVGLGTGLFPASDQTNSLDLRTTIIAGDVSPRDRDRYAFFESMLGARGPVTLSYVARDAASGDLIEPSSLIYELAEVMTPYLATSDASETLATLTARHPLNRFDDRYLTDVRLAPGRTLLGDRERAATRLRHVMSTHLRNHGYEIPSDRALTTMLERAPQTGILRALGVQSIVAPSTTATQRASSSSLSIDILRKFLVSPIQAWASASLGLVNDVDGREDLDVDDEPRAVDLLVHSSLLTDSIERMLRDGDRNVADVLGEVVALWRARGRYPVGIFGAAANAADRELLTLWRAELLKRNVGRPARFGFGRGNARCTSLLPAVLLHAANRELLLVGATELHHENAGAIITVPGEAKEKHHLRGMFHHVVHAAAGISAELPGRYTLLSKNGKVESIELHPWSQVDARAYLEELATELLTTSHGYLLPLSTAIDACTGKAVELPSDSVGPGALDYGPITHDEDLSMPSVDDAIAMATRRLQPLLARCGVGSKYSDDKPVGVAKPAKVAKASSKKSKPSAAERGDD